MSDITPADDRRENTFAAVDLGASSGRVLRGRITTEELTVHEVHRFPNRPLSLPDGLYWNIGDLYQQTCTGLAAAGPVHSAGIDTWAVDYGLLDAGGTLLGLPRHYRDPRTEQLPRLPIGVEELFARTGIADQPFNTVHQLRAESPERLGAARQLLMIPDLLGYWLTGVPGSERTNASTAGLYGLAGRDWDRALIAELGLPATIFGAIHDPGSIVGTVRPEVGADVGSLVRVGSHDTASAVAAVPATGDSFAYISCGTWSLVGIERPEPLLTDAARTAGFTNETGVAGFRYLRNVIGLWILQECLREWPGLDAAALAAAAAELPPLRAVIDVDDPAFAAPGTPTDPMPARIAARCDGPVPGTPAEFARCVIDSLALGHARAVADTIRTSGHPVTVVHVVGGGARNALLCQATADACGLPVLAGPAEATALGNLLSQAITAGVLPDWSAARRLVATTYRPHRYEPSGDPGGAEATYRFGALDDGRVTG
ncbi:rhamnulokinase [Nocardia aurantia]|uniref:Rhamnulokinase n=1 Tax=Nocardia aurantia TaxID=2585199 RepID=A0A7K0DYS3_9NOCA|nr:rhamnulokinase family protein [Nocardia aurantia]MQY30960.1 Rhamnulokinase [Nocardia aurantia]